MDALLFLVENAVSTIPQKIRTEPALPRTKLYRLLLRPDLSDKGRQGAEQS